MRVESRKERGGEGGGDRQREKERGGEERRRRKRRKRRKEDGRGKEKGEVSPDVLEEATSSAGPNRHLSTVEEKIPNA